MGFLVRYERASDLARAGAYAGITRARIGSGNSPESYRNTTPNTTWGPGRFWTPRWMLLGGPAGLLALAVFGQQYNPGAWWLIALMTALVVRTSTQRYASLERRFARMVGTLAVVWLSLAWQVGPYRLELILPLVALTPLAVLSWAAYRFWRGLPTIDWPRARSRDMRAWHTYARELQRAVRLQVRAAREWGRMQARWPWTSRLRQIGLPDSSLIDAHWGRSGPAWVRLELGAGKTLDDVRLVKGALESEWRLRPGSLHPKRPGEGLAHEALLEFRTVAELAPPPDLLPWPGKAPRNVLDPIVLGEFAGRRPVLLPLVERKDWRLAPHLLVTGQTGWGKGGFVNVVLAATAPLPEVEHWGIDAKGGLELGPWDGLFRRLADDGDSAIALLEEATVEMRRRWAIMRAARQRSWEPSPERPLIVFVVDEWAALPIKAKDLLGTLLAMARATGIWFVTCTQRASASLTGGTGQTGDAKSQLGIRVSYWQASGDEDLTFGDDAKRLGWLPSTLDRRGLALVRWPGKYDRPDPFQTYWVDNDVVAEMNAKAAALRGPRPSDEEAHAPEPALPVRPEPPPAEATQIAEPMRPALHLVAPVAREDPLSRLLGLLDAAPEEGVERAELIRLVEMSDSWVDKKLKGLRDAGEADQVARARWRRAGSNVVAMRRT